MYQFPPSNPRFQLIATKQWKGDIDILIFDRRLLTHTNYLQSSVKLIKDKELKAYLFSLRRYINEGRYEIED